MEATYNIICFGFMPWSNMWKRNQSMMAELAKYDFITKVIFVNPTLSIRSLVANRPTHGKLLRGRTSTKYPFPVSPKLCVFSPVQCIPDRKYWKPLRVIENAITLKLIRHLNKGKPYIVFMNSPNISTHDLLDNLLESASASIFDFSDDFMELSYDESAMEVFRHNITKYAKAADMVLAVNEHVKLRYAALNANIHVIRNATNYSNFDRHSYRRIESLERIRNVEAPIIGYVGTANMSRMDSELLDYLVRERPLWQFVFIGIAYKQFVCRYAKYHNVHILDPVDYEELPDYMHYFDVAVVPFGRNMNTMGNDLLKLHDYLAMGKPVVSTEVAGAKDLKDIIVIAHTPQEFMDGIEQALINGSADDVRRRKKVAQRNSWSERTTEVEELIQRQVGL